jgi:hypothetical protein
MPDSGLKHHLERYVMGSFRVQRPSPALVFLLLNGLPKNGSGILINQHLAKHHS